jgi:hypothetical protein
MNADDGPDEHQPTPIVRDRDRTSTEQFCSIFEDDHIEFREIPPLSSNMNPFAKAWAQRKKREFLTEVIVFGERHLRRISILKTVPNPLSHVSGHLTNSLQPSPRPGELNPQNQQAEGNHHDRRSRKNDHRQAKQQNGRADHQNDDPTPLTVCVHCQFLQVLR